MNNKEKDILFALYQSGFATQRKLQEHVSYSLGVINEGLKRLKMDNYIDENNELLEKGKLFIEENRPKKAVILSAGYGMRMVPINTESPKGLLTVKGQVLIERIINQLQEAGVEEIKVVVGFMKEKFEYLMDKYNVELVVNKDYGEKNNLWTLYKAGDLTGGCFVVPSNLYCKENPFLTCWMYSWYMVAEDLKTGRYSINRKRYLVETKKGMGNYRPLKIGYISKEDGEKFTDMVRNAAVRHRYEQSKWEEVLLEGNSLQVVGRIWNSQKLVEISTYEDLREVDSSSDQLKSDAIDIICQSFGVEANAINHISVLKKGMTNRSFIFSIGDKRYIMRIPGEGSSQMINRCEEAQIYKAIDGLKISDQLIYINAETGYKISAFIENGHECDCNNWREVAACMEKLREFHKLGLKVDHSFDLFQKIEYYEHLRGEHSVYGDYEQTKHKIMQLKTYIDEQEKEWVLTHIDANPDNFIIYKGIDGLEEIRLIDWEYAAMNDPHLDVAMFAIYALYDKPQIDKLIELYFEEKPSNGEITKIYCYIAICGLLWSNWCEYKKKLGIEFGEYSLKQYRYAKEFYKLAKSRMEEENLPS